jgi:hypothetical protein
MAIASESHNALGSPRCDVLLFFLVELTGKLLLHPIVDIFCGRTGWDGNVFHLSAMDRVVRVAEGFPALHVGRQGFQSNINLLCSTTDYFSVLQYKRT